MTELKPGTLIQITNKENRWFPAVATVDEPRGWGCIAYIYTAQVGKMSHFYVRLPLEDFEIVGNAVVVLKEEDQ